METVGCKIIIAVDGFSASGKSTLSKILADRLSYKYIDTGAMYRAIAYYVYKNKFFEFDNKEFILKTSQLEDNLSLLKIHFEKNNKGIYTIHLNDVDVEPFIRTEEISSLVSLVAKLPFVRKILTTQQRYMGRQKGIVMDGRDIGSVVFPQAELKFYVTANPEVRAKRRYQQLQNTQVTYEDVLNKIIHRDYQDLNRKCAPLMMAKDAIEINNSMKTIEEQIEFMYSVAVERIRGM